MSSICTGPVNPLKLLATKSSGRTRLGDAIARASRSPEHSWLALAAVSVLLCGCPKSQPYLVSPNSPILKPFTPGGPVSVAPPPATQPTAPPSTAAFPPNGIPNGAADGSLANLSKSIAADGTNALANAAQITELERRARVLDENNRQLYNQLAQAQQQTQTQRERADLMQRQLGDLSTQLQQARLALAAPNKAPSPNSGSSLANSPPGGSPSPPVRSNARLTANTSSGTGGRTAGSEIQIVAALRGLGYPLDTDGTSLRLRVPADQLFQPGSAQWTSSAGGLLDRIAEALQTGGSSARISIESHTDTVAKSAPDFSPELLALQASVQGQQSSPSSSDSVALEAKRLTEAQANAIEYYWRQRGAFAPGQLTARAAGASQPIMENQTPAGRATNRRVEFTLYGFR
jgi:outer membrane protein OmpA-like peptidoglycan-associated protein